MTAWFDIDRTLAEMDAFRRQMDGIFDVLDGRSSRGQTRYLGWSALPEAHLRDSGEELVLTAEVPGLSAEQIDLQVTQAGLTLSGERTIIPPEGYDTHRQERRAYKFSRSFQLPVKVDPDKVSARVENGILTVRLPKAAEVQPRRISIQ